MLLLHVLQFYIYSLNIYLVFSHLMLQTYTWEQAEKKINNRKLKKANQIKNSKQKIGCENPISSIDIQYFNKNVCIRQQHDKRKKLNRPSLQWNFKAWVTLLTVPFSKMWSEINETLGQCIHEPQGIQGP